MKWLAWVFHACSRHCEEGQHPLDNPIGVGGGGVKSLAAECVVWLRAQDRAADGRRPLVLFVLLEKRPG
jgi:hypothetical protein